MTLPLEQRQYLEVSQATLSLPAAQRLLVETNNHLLGNEKNLEAPQRAYVEECLGAITCRLDEVDKDAAELGTKLGTPKVNIGGVLYGARTDMRVRYGDASFANTGLPLDPDRFKAGLEGAYFANEAVGAVKYGFGEVYATWPKEQSRWQKIKSLGWLGLTKRNRST